MGLLVSLCAAVSVVAMLLSAFLVLHSRILLLNAFLVLHGQVQGAKNMATIRIRFACALC